MRTITEVMLVVLAFISGFWASIYCHIESRELIRAEYYTATRHVVAQLVKGRCLK